MASFDSKDIKCSVCGKELLRKNITGDIETKVKSLDETLEPYKTSYSLKSII